ncbi:MAG: hypothetical protein H0X37_05050 [Herpetosiphonaceae bacterium]|nr:hypothetical protein [Herpetosiphonaceae bacterium]
MPYMTLARIVVFVFGLVAVYLTMMSTIRTFVLPRSTTDRLTRKVFLTTRWLFNLRTSLYASYEGRDAIMALYAPVSLLVLLLVWLCCVLAGYTAMFWAIGVGSWRVAFSTSGSSLLTLGFAPLVDLPTTLVAFSEAIIGLVLVALLIAYLPTMYSAFARREAAVTLLEVRAGSPPSAVEMLGRFHRIQGFDRLLHVWTTWEAWFADISESHTSLAALAFFRSPQPRHSWVTASGAVLDAAALYASTIDAPRDAQAELCVRAGYVALRSIADLYNIHYPTNPKPEDPISITRAEYDAAYDRLSTAGLPLKPNRDQCWRDFMGWRVNYDHVLLALARLTMAPPAPWSSDRMYVAVELSPAPHPIELPPSA